MNDHQRSARPVLLGVSLALAAALSISPAQTRESAPEGPAEGASETPPVGSDKAPGVGERAALFQAPDLSGKLQDLPALLDGKVALLAFWASWCQPCVEEIPRLRILRSEYRVRGLEVVGVGIRQGRDSVRRQRDIARRHFMDYTTVFDEDGKFQDAYKVSALPWNMLIGRDGRIAWKGTLLPRDLEDRVKGLLSEELAGGAGEGR